MNQELRNIQDEIWKRLFVLSEQVERMLIRKVQFVIDQNKKNVTGDLRKSIDGEIYRRVEEILLTIFSGTNYAEDVHEGTRPHFPPIYKIRDWVRQKGLAGRYSVKTKRRLGNRMNQYWEDTEIAYKIAWKIYKKGTTGLKFFDIALKQATPEIQRMIDNFKIS